MKSSILSQAVRCSVEKPWLGCKSLGGEEGTHCLSKSPILPDDFGERHLMVWKVDALPTHGVRMSSINTNSLLVHAPLRLYTNEFNT
jgi:hypothetical protein